MRSTQEKLRLRILSIVSFLIFCWFLLNYDFVLIRCNSSNYLRFLVDADKSNHSKSSGYHAEWYVRCTLYTFLSGETLIYRTRRWWTNNPPAKNTIGDVPETKGINDWFWWWWRRGRPRNVPGRRNRRRNVTGVPEFAVVYGCRSREDMNLVSSIASAFFLRFGRAKKALVSAEMRAMLLVK